MLHYCSMGWEIRNRGGGTGGWVDGRIERRVCAGPRMTPACLRKIAPVFWLISGSGSRKHRCQTFVWRASLLSRMTPGAHVHQAPGRWGIAQGQGRGH